jgi:TRAP transporter TAXI family solute receptor
MTAGSPGGGVLAFSESLAAAYAAALPGAQVQARQSEGAAANISALERGDAEVGFTFANLAFEAFRQHGELASPLRAIAVLQVSPTYLVVAQHSRIMTVADLRGGRVGVNRGGSGGAATAEVVLRAYGLLPADVQLVPVRNDQVAMLLDQGSIDAFFALGGFVTDTMRSATRAGARLIPFRGEATERLRRDYSFFRPAIIPQGAYPGVVETFRTIGIETLFVCRSDLDEGLVYDLTRMFYDALPTLARSQDILRFADLDQSAAAPIPLHPGAARYYREQELMR